MSDLHCYASLDPVRVIERCESYLDCRAESIKKKKEEAVQKIMERRVGWPWKRRNLTRDEAFAIASTGSSGDTFDVSAFARIEMKGSYWSDRVQALLHLASAAKRDGHPVIVSAEMAQMLYL